MRVKHKQQGAADTHTHTYTVTGNEAWRADPPVKLTVHSSLCSTPFPASQWTESSSLYQGSVYVEY